MSAVLHCDETPQLLLLNGGSESEQLHVDVVVPAVREPLCFGTHAVEAGKFVIVDLPRPTRSVKMRVRVIGGPQPIVLDEPTTSFRIPVARLATAAALAVGFGSLLLLPDTLRSVKPVAPTTRPVAAVATHQKPKHQIHVAVVRAPAPSVASVPFAPAVVVPHANPDPPVVAVSTPSRHVVNGDPITISFKSNGQQVRIVATIGPRTIEDRIIGASHGKLLLKPPPSSDIRVLTINASAQSDGMQSSRSAIVILLPNIPIPTPSVTNL